MEKGNGSELKVHISAVADTGFYSGGFILVDAREKFASHTQFSLNHVHLWCLQ